MGMSMSMAMANQRLAFASLGPSSVSRRVPTVKTGTIAEKTRMGIAQAWHLDIEKCKQ